LQNLASALPPTGWASLTATQAGNASFQDGKAPPFTHHFRRLRMTARGLGRMIFSLIKDRARAPKANAYSGHTLVGAALIHIHGVLQSKFHYSV
jgi:hypothetical protein